MNRRNWRSSEDFKPVQTLDAVGFGFQFLSRKPDFVRDRERMQQLDRQGALEPAEVTAFARRWGLLCRRDK